MVAVRCSVQGAGPSAGRVGAGAAATRGRPGEPWLYSCGPQAAVRGWPAAEFWATTLKSACCPGQHHWPSACSKGSFYPKGRQRNPCTLGSPQMATPGSTGPGCSQEPHRGLWRGGLQPGPGRAPGAAAVLGEPAWHPRQEPSAGGRPRVPGRCSLGPAGVQEPASRPPWRRNSFLVFVFQ